MSRLSFLFRLTYFLFTVKLWVIYLLFNAAISVTVINMKTRCIRLTNLQNLSTKLAVKQRHLMETHTHCETQRQQLLLHPFNSLFSRTTWVSQYQKGKTGLDLDGARDYGVLGWQWHQLDHVQTICILLQTDNHINTSSLNFTGHMLFLMPNQQQCHNIT